MLLPGDSLLLCGISLMVLIFEDSLLFYCLDVGVAVTATIVLGVIFICCRYVAREPIGVGALMVHAQIKLGGSHRYTGTSISKEPPISIFKLQVRGSRFIYQTWWYHSQEGCYLETIPTFIITWFFYFLSWKDISRMFIFVGNAGRLMQVIFLGVFDINKLKIISQETRHRLQTKSDYNRFSIVISWEHPIFLIQ